MKFRYSKNGVSGEVEDMVASQVTKQDVAKSHSDVENLDNSCSNTCE